MGSSLPRNNDHCCSDLVFEVLRTQRLAKSFHDEAISPATHAHTRSKQAEPASTPRNALAPRTCRDCSEDAQ
eukprot:11387184-Alexandrium_andersonii.AAC.1